MKKYFVVLSGIAVLSLLAAGLVLCQEESSPAQEAPAAPAAPAVPAAPKTESVYGEVMAVNEAGSSLTVQYYDYDTDEEKNMDLGLDKETKLENASALKDVKVGDWVDATYVASLDGKKAAKTVKVEKAEEPEPMGGETADEGVEEE